MAFDKMLTEDSQNLELFELIKLGKIVDSLYISPKKRGIFVVGGAIRDILTNSFPADLDLVVEDDPENFAKKIAKKIKGRLVKIGKEKEVLYRVISKNKNIDITQIQGASINEDLSRRDFTINAMAYDLYSGVIIDNHGGRQDIAEKRVRMVTKSSFNRDPIRQIGRASCRERV